MNNQRKNSGISVLCGVILTALVIVLLGAKRQPLIYAEKNEMNYETTQEQREEKNDEVVMEEETTFSTEEQITEEKNTDVAQSEKVPGKTTEDKKPGGKKQKGDQGKKTIPDDDSDNTKPEEKKMVSLQVIWEGKDELLYGYDFDPSAVQVFGNYNNGETERIAIEDCTRNGFEPFRLGNGTCVFQYYGLSTSVTYTILNYETGITCAAWDKQQSYRYGDSFSKSDISLVADMADGTKEPIATSAFDVTYVDTKKIGTNTCRILYKDFSLKESYTVHNYPVALSSNIDRFVIRGEITWDDVAAKLSLKAKMADGSEKKLAAGEYNVSGYDYVHGKGGTAVLQYEDVQLKIPYKIYHDEVTVIMPDESDTYSIAIHHSLTLKDVKDFGPQQEYTKGKDTYRFEGLYLDAAFKKPWKGPVTYVAEDTLEINEDGMDYHQYTIYAKYVKVEKPTEEKTEEPAESPTEEPKQEQKRYHSVFDFWRKK